MPIVPPTKHAQDCTVLTHVLDFVVSMPNAGLSTISLHALVSRDMKGILSHLVAWDQNVRHFILDLALETNTAYLAIEPVVADDPCDPNPCGPNSLPPRDVGGRCQCTCMREMIGSPPNCRPECVINSDCPSDKACINRKCQDPCPGLCGQNAYCRVRNHIPICVCNQGYEGDPFSRCTRITSKCLQNMDNLLLNRFISNIIPPWNNRPMQPNAVWN